MSSLYVDRGFTVDVRMYMCTYVHAYTRMYVHTYMHTYVRMYEHTYVHTHTPDAPYMVSTHTHAHTHTSYKVVVKVFGYLAQDVLRIQQLIWVNSTSICGSKCTQVHTYNDQKGVTTTQCFSKLSDLQKELFTH